jgi:phosphatidate cytidylyltransferase
MIIAVVPGSLNQWIGELPTTDLALALALLVVTAIALPMSRRGGRFRGLPGWVGFWVGFAAILLCLTHAPRWISFPMLALLMFAALRTYFYVAPVRARDRYAVLAAYLAIPIALWPAYVGSREGFLATVPVALFLFIPVFLALGPAQEGMLDSMGRTLLGVVFFVFCTAHIGLLVNLPNPELPELFGVLVLGAELPRRLGGNFRRGGGWLTPGIGLLTGLVLSAALGYWLGPTCGLVDEDGARAGFLVAVAVNLGAPVSHAVARDLAISASSSAVGRGAVLGRTVPAVYAAPVFFHYLNYFA